MVRLKIIWFILKTFLLPYGKGTSRVEGESGIDVTYNITDENGNYSFIKFKKGNHSE
jgi:hypothetical protein